MANVKKIEFHAKGLNIVTQVKFSAGRGYRDENTFYVELPESFNFIDGKYHRGKMFKRVEGKSVEEVSEKFKQACVDFLSLQASRRDVILIKYENTILGTKHSDRNWHTTDEFTTLSFRWWRAIEIITKVDSEKHHKGYYEKEKLKQDGVGDEIASNDYANESLEDYCAIEDTPENLKFIKEAEKKLADMVNNLKSFFNPITINGNISSNKFKNIFKTN